MNSFNLNMPLQVFSALPLCDKHKTSTTAPNLHLSTELCRDSYDVQVKTWRVGDKKINLIHDQTHDVQAIVIAKNNIVHVSNLWISGIPGIIKKNRDLLTRFLEDTYVTLSASGNDQFSLHVRERLRGGTNHQRLDRTVIELIKEAIEHAKMAKDKHITAMIGITGTGKSTIVNQLLGKRMIYDDVENVIKVKPGEKEEAKIGHRKGTSETRYAQTYVQNQSTHAYADCGGFYDTRGISNDIAVLTSTRLTLENAKSVKIVLCVDAALISTDRGVHLAKMVEMVLGTLFKKYTDHQESFLLMITKPPLKRSGQMYSTADAHKALKELRDDLDETTELHKFYKFLMREEGKYVCVCDPLSDASKDEMLLKLGAMRAIENPKTAFNVTYSAHSKLKLLEEMTAIAVVGTDLYTKHAYSVEAATRYSGEIAKLNENITAIQKSIKGIGNGQGDALEIEKAGKEIIENHNKIIKENQTTQSNLDAKMKEIKAEIESIDEKKKVLSLKNDVEELYWTDQIEKEGINVQSHSTTTTTKEKSGWFSSSSTTTVKKDVIDHKEPIEKDFHYKGPEFSKIEREPKEGACWSDEKKDKTSYSVSYKTAPGEAAKASLKVYVKGCNLPENVIKMGGFNQEIATKQVALQKLTEEHAKATKTIYEAKAVVSAKGTTLEKLETFKKSAKELEESLKEKQTKLEAVTKESLELAKKIGDLKDDFKFLNDYVAIANDEELKKKEAIAKFIELDVLYQSAQAKAK